MNIQVQCCGMAILLLLLYFFLRQKRLGLYSERIFLRVVGISLLCVCLDILSIIAIVNHERIPELLVKFVCKTYIVSLTWVGFFGMIYSIMDLHMREQNRRVIIEHLLIVLMGSLAIYILPIQYYLDGNIVYTYGPSCIMTYIVALWFVFATLYMVTKYGNKMNPKRKNAVRLWMFMWIIAAVTQFLDAKLLLVGFATAYGMMILFFELENPEANIDRETGAYNAHALREYVKQRYENKNPFAMLLIGLEAYRENEEKMHQIDVALKKIVQFLEMFQDVKVFKNVERELVLLVESEQWMKHVFKEIKERFQSEWNENDRENTPILLEPYYVLIPNSSIIANADEIFRMVKYYKNEKYAYAEKSVIYIDEEKVEHLRTRDKTEQMIISAIEDDRVEVFYQPIYSVKQECFTSGEALVRIREKDGSFIPPGQFIPVAEETGLICQLGEIVFDKTCRFIKENKLKNYGVDYIEINLSVKQCEKAELSDIYIAIMKKYDLEPRCINLEITETASIQMKKILVENMERLIAHGVHFTLDDFGNGESNLNYIVEMPVSIVKFDRDMSQAYFENKKAKFVMEAAMKMIHDMELKIVSEGVETKEQMETIVGLGIDYIQGYYFSKPLSAAMFLKFIKQNNRK